MATREKKFILEFNAPKESCCDEFHNYDFSSYRVGIAPHPQKNKFPHLYSVYIWKWNGLREDWVKEYYYDREQKCFFRPYKMQYLESVGRTARYIRDKLIVFFTQLAKAKEQEEKALQEARDKERRRWARFYLEREIASKYEDYCGDALGKFMLALSDLENATKGKTLAEAEKSIKALPEAKIRYGCGMLNYYYKIEQLANWETDSIENVIQTLLSVAISWDSMFNIQPEASASTPEAPAQENTPATTEQQAQPEASAQKTAQATTANSSAQKVTLLDTATARKLMAKKKLNVEEIIELLKATYNGMPNFTTILSKGSIETLREVNQKTVLSPEIGTAYYGFCKKTEIVSELNRLFCELLLDIRENGDLHQHRRTESTRENGIERTRRYYDDVVKAWLYQFSRTNHPVEYEDKIIEINLQPETPAYTPEIIPAVDQPAQPAPVEIKHSTPRNIHEVVIIAESYDTISAPETAPVKINPEVKPDYDAAFDETAYSPDVQEVSVIVDDIPADHEPDNYCAVFTVGYRYVFHGAEYTIVKKTAKTITMKYMDVLGVQTQTRKLYIDSRSEYTHPEGTYGAGMDAPEWQLRADGPFIPANPQTSQPAITAPVQEVKSNTPANPEPEPARKSAPKQATRKPRHAVKIDDSRQILIQFDDEQTPAPESTPAKPKARRPRKPRIKRDYSRQILINFGENIPDGQTNQRKAA